MQSGSVTFLFHPTRERLDAVRSVADHARLPVAEVLRRMIDRCLRDGELDEVIPSASGTDWTAVRKS